MKLRKTKGFTVAELLIVVAIIAVLVAVAIPTFTIQLESSKEAVDISIIRNAYAAGKSQFFSLSSADFEVDGYASFLWDNSAGELLENNYTNFNLLTASGYLRGTNKDGGKRVQIGEGAKSNGRTDGVYYDGSALGPSGEGFVGCILMMDIYPDGVVEIGMTY